MDKIANLITSLKNAGSVGQDMVTIPFSKFNLAILELLEKEGYIKSVSKKGKKIHKTLEAGILYVNGLPRIQGVSRVSHFSMRVYERSKDLKSVRSGYGNFILSTTKGIMTDVMAKKEKVGGEVLFKIW